MSAERANDTSPDIEALRVEAYRRMSPAEKVECVRALNQSVQQLALADIKRRHPHAGERELHLRLASRWIPRDLMVQAFGWDVGDRGY
jgi:hypothetical protein